MRNISLSTQTGPATAGLPGKKNLKEPSIKKALKELGSTLKENRSYAEVQGGIIRVVSGCLSRKKQLAQSRNPHASRRLEIYNLFESKMAELFSEISKLGPEKPKDEIPKFQLQGRMTMRCQSSKPPQAGTYSTRSELTKNDNLVGHYLSLLDPYIRV